MIFDIQMYHEEMQVKFEYGCDPTIIEGVIALGLKTLLENEFPFIFSLMVGWIQMIFGIWMYHEEMKVKSNMGAAQLLLEKLLPLDLKNLYDSLDLEIIEKDSFRSFSQ
jgi:hypothetical protein